jgi:ERCC4-type nuclease
VLKLPAKYGIEDCPPLWRDTREPDHDPWRLRGRGFRVESVCLPFGDLTVAGLDRELIIERKTKNDLVACVGRERERFEKCVTGLLGFRFPYLIVEACWNELEHQSWPGSVSVNAVLGSLTGWQCRGLHVILADDAERAGTIAARICFMHARRAYLQARELFANLRGDETAPCEEATTA